MNQIFARLVLYTNVQILSFGAIVTLIFYFTVYDDGGMLRQQIATLRSALAEEQEKKNETDRLLQEESRMKESIAILSQQYQEISRRLPSSLTSIELNRNIDMFARNAGVSIRARKPLEVVRGNIIEEVPIEVNLQGSFAELAQFIFVVSSSERVTALQRFSITPIERSTRLNFEGVVVGYQLAPERPDPAQGSVQ